METTTSPTAVLGTPTPGWQGLIGQRWLSLFDSRPRDAVARAELLARAESYAATQPGYAADLRAAAERLAR